jgi:hypothetical protein
VRKPEAERSRQRFAQTDRRCCRENPRRCVGNLTADGDVMRHVLRMIRPCLRSRRCELDISRKRHAQWPLKGPIPRSEGLSSVAYPVSDASASSISRRAIRSWYGPSIDKVFFRSPDEA